MTVASSFRGRLLLLAAMLSLAAPADAGTLAITQISASPLFVNDKPPVYDGNTVAWYDPLTETVNVSAGGVESFVTTPMTPMPGAPAGSVFRRPSPPAIDNGAVSFVALDIFNTGHMGVFTTAGGSLRVVADKSTPIPGGTGNFLVFADPVSTDAGNTAFIGLGDNNQYGVYLEKNGTLIRVADTTTPRPNFPVPFTAFTGVSLEGNKVAFVDFGVYVSDGTSLTRIADINTPVPGGGTGSTFQGPFFTNVDLDNGNVAFKGVGTFGGIGIYLWDGTSLVAKIDSSTPLPGGSDGIGFLGGFDMEDGKIAFAAAPCVEIAGVSTCLQTKIFTDLSGQLEEMISTGDLLFGKEVISLFVGSGGLGDDGLAFRAGFRDGSTGIFLAQLVDVPEPAGASLVGAAMLGFMRWRRRLAYRPTA